MCSEYGLKKYDYNMYSTRKDIVLIINMCKNNLYHTILINQ